jgi:hypothetical protein
MVCMVGMACSTCSRSGIRHRGRGRYRWTRRRAFDPYQTLLLPPSLNDWLPEDHLARFVTELVDEVLDLTPILADYTEKPGVPALRLKLPLVTGHLETGT